MCSDKQQTDMLMSQIHLLCNPHRGLLKPSDPRKTAENREFFQAAEGEVVGGGIEKQSWKETEEVRVQVKLGELWRK